MTVRTVYETPAAEVLEVTVRRMPRTVSNHDPLNHAPDNADVALLLIDVINDLEFDGAENLLAYALPMAPR